MGAFDFSVHDEEILSAACLGQEGAVQFKGANSGHDDVKAMNKLIAGILKNRIGLVPGH